ncbi:MAG: ribonuclease III [Lachnospiraceae bacterium]|nr:ribonuclease III [Lachnospiraceae bacterium]
MVKELEGLQKRIGVTFHDPTLLLSAMTHSSFYNEHRKLLTCDNERLEFLGDAVLELVSSELLFHTHTEMQEGELTTLRAKKVCEPTLAHCARLFDLPKYILLGRGEDMSGGRNRDSIVSDALEALIGAIFLDQGFEGAKAFVLRFVLIDLEEKELFRDSKTILQEIVQERMGEKPVYTLIGEDGPEHDRIFYMSVSIGGKEYAKGQGSSKKAAQQMAAEQAILKIRKKNNN